jgi:hypothetical protein
MTPLAEKIEVPADPTALFELSLAEGWGDGVPILPPTDAAVEGLLAHTALSPETVLGIVPPKFRPVTVELAAINAAMAGVEPAAFPIVIAAVRSILDDDFAPVAIFTTTSAAHPMLIVNGPARDRFGIDYRGSCLGGAGGRGSTTVGRAISLIIRNVGGQKANETTMTVFGQPARFGMCFGEWEEKSFWPTLAERRGFEREQEVVSTQAGIGTHAMYEDITTNPESRAAMLGKSICYQTNSVLVQGWATGDFVILINPVWAELFGRHWPRIEDFQAFVWEHACQPVDSFPREFIDALSNGRGLIDGDKLRLAKAPHQIVPVVCGGLGSHQSVLLNSFGPSMLTSRAVERG